MHCPKHDRYSKMEYNRCGRSGLKLPAVSLGLWHNFGSVDDYENCRQMIFMAFDNGIIHFDLANNYGPEAGTAEETFGRIVREDIGGYRNELVVSTKAGHYMWEGPYGDWGSRKYLLSSLDESLLRMGLEYVDIFYSHRPDPETPLEETMGALADAVKQGKALYAGISQYNAEQTAKAADIISDLGTPCLIHQPRYSMFDRWVEDGLLDVLEEKGIGSIAFCPLAQGLLTDKYLNGIPEDSRAAKPRSFLKKESITEEIIYKIKMLNELAGNRGISLAQLSLKWVLRDSRITSVLIGASRPEQIVENIGIVGEESLSQEEILEIDRILEG